MTARSICPQHLEPGERSPFDGGAPSSQLAGLTRKTHGVVNRTIRFSTAEAVLPP